MNAVDRAELLASLLEAPERCGEIMTKLRELGWDADDELAQLSRNHLISVLEAVDSGRLSQTDVEAWANAIEGRDDVGREHGHEAVVSEALHWLANPMLEGEATPSAAQHWLRRLVP